MNDASIAIWLEFAKRVEEQVATGKYVIHCGPRYVMIEIIKIYNIEDRYKQYYWRYINEKEVHHMSIYPAKFFGIVGGAAD